MNQILHWFREIYFDQIDVPLLDGSKKYKEMLNSSISFPSKRMFAFIDLKYTLNMKTSGYTYIAFYLVHGERRVIYAVAYYINEVPIYVCLSPTFLSSKGEFRDAFIPFSAFNQVFIKWGKQLSPIEDAIRKKISEKEFIIEYNTYPRSKIADEDIIMLGTRMLITSTYLILYRKQYDLLQIHTDKLYVDMLKNIIKSSSYIINDNHIYNYLFNGNLHRSYGQKITPMSVGEVIKINNITYPVWRELYISYAASDMVINGISPHFAISANWSYIEGVDHDMFDNSIIRERYKQNDEVIEVINRLKLLYKYSESIDNIEDSRQQIFNTMRKINSYKLLSNIAMCRIDEFVDSTIGTIPHTMRTAQIPPPKYYNFLKKIEYFDKIIFDLMYGIHTLHKKIGAIHLDLHLNNMTIMEVENDFYKKGKGKYVYDKDTIYHTAYVIDGQRETYLFPFEGYYGTIIDFSDSVVSRNFLEFTSKSVTFDSFENIIDREKDYIYEKLSSALSYARKYKDKVRGSIISNYEDMFKAITAIDFVSITRNIRIMLERDFSNYVHEDILHRIKELEDISLEHLLMSVQNVVDKEGKDVKFAGDVLLSQFFSNYKYSPSMDNVTVYEVYKFNAPWNHSSVSVDKYPPWADKNVVEKKYGLKKAEEVFGVRDRPMEIDRDVHLAFLVEKISTEYGINVIQTSRAMEDN